jgi:hypothetical protein
MRQYIQIVFGLLLPISGLFMVISFLYYNQNNDFSEALKLGVLTGFFIAIILSPFIGFFIYLMRIPKRSKKNTPKTTSPTRQKSKPIKSKQEKQVASSSGEPKKILSSNKNIILLMDKELTVNIMLHAINEQNIGQVTRIKGEQETIGIQSKEGNIELIVSSLTAHTAEIVIEMGEDTQGLKKILNYIKEKEYSYLDY